MIGRFAPVRTEPAREREVRNSQQQPVQKPLMEPQAEGSIFPRIPPQDTPERVTQKAWKSSTAAGYSRVSKSLSSPDSIPRDIQFVVPHSGISRVDRLSADTRRALISAMRIPRGSPVGK